MTDKNIRKKVLRTIIIVTVYLAVTVVPGAPSSATSKGTLPPDYHPSFIFVDP